MSKILIAAEPVSAYDAKTHLPKLLQRTEAGARFVITRHGKPVAQLIPIDSSNKHQSEQAARGIAAIRKKLENRGITLGSVLKANEVLRDLTHSQHKY